jgi:hypothetical protein
LLLAQPLGADVRSQLIAALQPAGDRSRQITGVLQTLTALPEFQLA